jgi:hypothetical protein
MDTFRLGAVSITRVVEIGRSFYPTTSMLPESTPEAIARHHGWLKPDFFDEDTGDLGSRIQTWVVRMPGRTILIDTGVGNGKERHESPIWNQRQGTWLDDLAAAGVKPEQVDTVVCTHLHVDHVGWNTRLEGGCWVPTFPRARYVIHGEEWQFWKWESEQGREPSGCIADSVRPVVEAGRVALSGGQGRRGRTSSNAMPTAVCSSCGHTSRAGLHRPRGRWPALPARRLTARQAAAPLAACSRSMCSLRWGRRRRSCSSSVFRMKSQICWHCWQSFASFLNVS